MVYVLDIQDLYSTINAIYRKMFETFMTYLNNNNHLFMDAVCKTCKKIK